MPLGLPGSAKMQSLPLHGMNASGASPAYAPGKPGWDRYHRAKMGALWADAKMRVLRQKTAGLKAAPKGLARALRCGSTTGTPAMISLIQPTQPKL